MDQPSAERALMSAYRRFGQQATRWLERYTARGGQVFCGAGCFHCCDMPIRTNLLEALTLAHSLPHTQLAAMRRHADKVRANARASTPENYAERHRAEVGFCPLLDHEQGICTAYEKRPSRCRDTFSAFPARYCAAGGWERLTRRERAEYVREVGRTPGTDGESHYLAPLEDLSLPVWELGSQLMRELWGVEVWGDFAVLVDLTQREAFWTALEAGSAKRVRGALKSAGLWQPDILEVI